MIKGSGLSRGVPDAFLEAFLTWEDKLSTLTYGEEVKEKAKQLSFDELLCLLGPKWQPALYSELFWFAVYELSQRKLTQEQHDLVREAWSRIKHICRQDTDSRYRIAWTGGERQKLWRLLGPNYLK